MIDIIFIHKGGQEYLYYALSQAKSSNPGASIHLIGDENNRIFRCMANHYYYRDYFKGAQEFQKYYRHYSTDGCSLVLFWFQRWFILRDFLIAHNIKKSFYADSDVMIYGDIEEEAKKFQEFDFTLSCNPRGLSAAPHCSFWNNIDPLRRFCQFVMDMYIQKDAENYNRMVEHYQNLQSKGLEGGVCDMTAFWLFKVNNFAHIADTRAIIDAATYDNNINIPNLNGEIRSDGDIEVEMKNGIKKIDWKDNIPYGTILKSGEKVRFNILHLQGQAKIYMNKFYRRNKREAWLKEVFYRSRCIYLSKLISRIYRLKKRIFSSVSLKR